MANIIIIGYSGHAYVVLDAAISAGLTIKGYCEREKKEFNPFNIPYLGQENNPESKVLLMESSWFVGIGDNTIRRKVIGNLISAGCSDLINIIHPDATISRHGVVLQKGILICCGVIINPFVQIGMGVICNTGCIIEHECIVSDFAHIAPGAVLCGKVTIGAGSFIGANTVVKQGVSIGHNVTVGAGSVVLNDLPHGVTAVGNPAKIIHS